VLFLLLLLLLQWFYDHQNRLRSFVDPRKCLDRYFTVFDDNGALIVRTTGITQLLLGECTPGNNQRWIMG
jgi:hypothetical protein